MQALRMRVPSFVWQSAIALVLLTHATSAGLAVREQPFWDGLKIRYWEDLHLAIGLYLQGEYPLSSGHMVFFRDQWGHDHVRQEPPNVAASLARANLAPWKFWGTIPPERFLGEARVVHRFDDGGRPLLLGLGFRMLHGIAPYLLFWIALLAAAPVLVWTAWELERAGLAWQGGAFVVSLGLWPYFADMLALDYAAAGFHALALLSVVPVAAYAAWGRPSARGVMLRAGVAGLFLGVCALCRSSALLVLPGLILGLALAVARIPTSRRWALLTFSAATGMLVAPYAVFRVSVEQIVDSTRARHGAAPGLPQQHAVWFGLWTGLGDFDRTKGYVWSDLAVNVSLARAGGRPLWLGGPYDPANEAILRKMILEDAVRDPLWLAAIFARRVWATVTQEKLWPWGPTSGITLRPSSAINEGVIDNYYALTTTAEHVGNGPWRLELPVPLLLLPAWSVAAGAVLVKRRDQRARLCRWAAVLACVAAGALPAPVLVTTASALEAQAFALVYVLGLALAAGEAGSRLAPGLRERFARRVK